MILETKRLYMREMTQEDYCALCRILQDQEVMYAYEHPFSDQEVHEWLDRQIKRYQDFGFGLWAVINRDTDEMIGQCGLTFQTCHDRDVVEVGYLFQKAFWHRGYAIEAASACKEYAFGRLGVKEVYSIIRDNNLASMNVAIRNGMLIRGKLVKHYYGIDMVHLVFAVVKNDGSGYCGNQ